MHFFLLPFVHRKIHCEQMSHDSILLLTSPSFSGFVENLGYIGIFIWFISLDQFTPIPEEITLLTIGYLAAHGIFNPFIAGIVSLVAFLAVDTAYYFLARSGNEFFQRFYKKKHRPFMDKYKKNIQENLPRTLIVLCFIPRMRMFGPITVGMMKLPYKRFILFDGIGVAIFTAIYISLGTVFRKSLELAELKHVIFICAMVGLAVIIFIFMRRMNREKKDAA